MSKLKQINLIPREALNKPLLRQLKSLYRKHKALRNLSIIALIFITFNLIQAFIIGMFSLNLLTAKKNMQQAKVKLNQLQSQYIQVEKLKSTLSKEESRRKGKLDSLLSTASGERRFSELLRLIPELTTQELWINRLVLRQDELNLLGSSLDNQMLTQFIDRLNESKSLRNSRFASSEKQVMDSHTLYNFQITAEPAWTLTENKWTSIP